jgi:hypothetical protein
LDKTLRETKVIETSFGVFGRRPRRWGAVAWVAIALKGDATAGNLGEFFEPVLGRSFDAGGEFCGFGLAHIN